MLPDLPTPTRTTLPRQVFSNSIARSTCSGLSREAVTRIASASIKSRSTTCEKWFCSVIRYSRSAPRDRQRSFLKHRVGAYDEAASNDKTRESFLYFQRMQLKVRLHLIHRLLPIHTRQRAGWLERRNLLSEPFQRSLAASRSRCRARATNR